MSPFVAACIVTYRRPVELARLLRGLKGGGAALGVVVVVDNAADDGTRRQLEEECAADPAFALEYVPSGNLGPGAGWKRGMEVALEKFGALLTHFWCLDDDVVVDGETLKQLLGALGESGVGAAAPLLIDAEGEIWAFPEPKERALRRTIREVKRPDEAMARLGLAPLEWVWCTGACMLVTRQAVERVGFHRTDFWMLGEDLDYSMRLSAISKCVFLPNLTVPHLPEPAADVAKSRQSHHRKFLALLQNLSYLSFRSSSSRHMWTYLPGNFRRFFRTEGFSAMTLSEAIFVFWKGAVCGRPRGSE